MYHPDNNLKLSCTLYLLINLSPQPDLLSWAAGVIVPLSVQLCIFFSLSEFNGISYMRVEQLNNEQLGKIGLYVIT